MKSDINFWRELKQKRPMLTPQQYRTLKGQAAAGRVMDARKGLQKIVRRRGT